jgi:hypothetical protein
VRIVLNEWILHDFRGDNGRPAQLESFEFLEALVERPDSIVIVLGSPWTIKAYSLMKHYNPVVAIGRFLNQSVLLDSSKCLTLTRHDLVQLPDALGLIDLKNDRYLFEAYYSGEAELIVTSDQRLVDKVATIQNLNLSLREDFLTSYR